MQSAAYRSIGVRWEVGSVGAELREAEGFFRKALRQTPTLVEARVRLARVLALLGRHQDAASELKRAVSATDDELLLYYGNLFLGAEETALGRLDDARAAYERAANLYPLAQSPHLALGELAYRGNKRDQALQSIEQVLTLSGTQDERPDPWWTYVAPGAAPRPNVSMRFAGDPAGMRSKAWRRTCASCRGDYTVTQTQCDVIHLPSHGRDTER